MHTCMRCGRPARSGGFLSRPASFSRTIAERHATRPAYACARLAMRLAQRFTQRESVHRHWHQWLLAVAPRIAIVVNGRSPVRAAGSQATVIGRRIDPDPDDYLQARARRIDTGGESPPMSGHPPVPRVLQRRAPPVAVEDEGAPSPKAPPGLSQREGVSTRARPAEVAVAPNLDVERLTEQVIKGIDRRIIAQRERLGRI